MPIYFADPNQERTIIEIQGDDKFKTHLANLGFVVGHTVKLVMKVDENVIVKIKGSTLAISKELAKRILV